MNMIISMAWRNIWRNKVRSVVIMISIALGLVAGVFIMGLYEGVLNDRLNTVIRQEVAHVQVHHPRFQKDYEAVFRLDSASRLVERIRSLDNVQAVSARTVAPGMLATSTGSAGVQILGVVPVDEDAVSGLKQKLIEGEGFTANRHNQVMIGRKLADKVNLRLNSKLVLTFTDSENNLVSAAFRVAGVYQSTNAPLEERLVYVHAADLNRLMQMEDACHEIAVLLSRDEAMTTAEQQLNRLYPNLLIENWQQLSPETKLMIETTDTYSVIFIIIIMLALMFGIINTMLMAVLERTREIGMLVALGMNKLRLFMLVVWETVILTLTGAPFGLLLSWLLITHLGNSGIDISSISGAAMSGFGFSSLIFPRFPWSSLPLVLYIVCITALLASLVPSFKALRLIPVEAMRQ